MKTIKIDGVDYVPRTCVAEALDIIAAFSQLYDNLAERPSEPTPVEKRIERDLTRRWIALQAKVYGN